MLRLNLLKHERSLFRRRRIKKSTRSERNPTQWLVLCPNSDDDCIQEVARVEEEDGDGGLAPLAQHPPAAEPLIPVRRKRKRPALSAQTWMVGSEDEERSLRRDERRAGAEVGGRCGVRLGRHRDEADCLSLPSGEGRGGGATSRRLLRLHQKDWLRFMR